MTGLILLFTVSKKLAKSSFRLSDFEGIFSETSKFEIFLDDFYVEWL